MKIVSTTGSTTGTVTYLDGDAGRVTINDDAEKHPWVPGATFQANPELLPMLRALEESGIETAEELRLRLLAVPQQRWEYGVERRLPQWNNGEPYMEWGASTGMSHHYEYTADNVHSLASGRVFRRRVTTFIPHYGEPEPYPRQEDSDA